MTGVAAGGAAAAIGALTFSGAQAKAGRTWDHETDIVVVGSGAAGLTAAVTACLNKDKVIVLEKASDPGGTCAKSGGVFWIPNHFGLRESGIVDARDECLRYLARYSYPELYTVKSPTLGLPPETYALLEAFYDNAAAMVDRVREAGALKVMQWKLTHLDRVPPDYFDHAPENKVPRGRPLAAEGADGKQAPGIEIIAQFEDVLNRAGAPILFEHPAHRLILNEAGDVIGIQAIHEGNTVNLKARKGVIFATGGFAHNTALIDRAQRTRIYGTCASSNATGDFVPIAEAVGAKLGNMSGAWRTEVVLEQVLEYREVGRAAFMPVGDSMIQVNRYGRRVVNEKRNYNDRTEIHFAYDPANADYPNHFMFTVYDRRTAEAYAGNNPLPSTPTGAPYVITGETLDDLAKAIQDRLESLSPAIGDIRLDPDFAQNLKDSVTRFNDFARKGVDLDFGRGAQAYDRDWIHYFAPQRDTTNWPPNPMPNVTMHPLEEKGPYYAIIVAPGVLDTNGGPVINQAAQVLNCEDKAIPGLYGAGNCIASPTREAYFGAGATIGLAMTFGYIAANSAHKERPKVS
jgi:succinate dehydrogenase/fumarate reductase flavoprotein subunit